MTTPSADVASFIAYTPSAVYNASDALLARGTGGTSERSHFASHSGERRRTPRKSMVVVLPNDLPVPIASFAEQLPEANTDASDIIIACAGEPAYLTTLRKSLGGAEFLVAPAGTSAEDLRELAMTRARGDIVTLMTALNGIRVRLLPADSTDSESVPAYS